MRPINRVRVSSNHGLAATLVRLARDEQGGEVIEYALVLGMIAVAAMAIVAQVGSRVIARWTSVNSSL